ncbi:MAG: hypothetical protein KJZ91_01350 [Myxococcales bacterium]|nr:hypothetical protein [Myxococcales bacterium]
MTRGAACAGALVALALVACTSGRAEERARPAPAPRPGVEAGELAPATPAGLCLTRGARAFDGGRLRVTEPTVRAVAPAAHGDAAALRFTFAGDSARTAKLASGQARRQLGLRLRAADGCNAIYVMWRLDPAPALEVSTKLNPGARDHGDCGARGYRKVAPAGSAPPPRLVPGATHTLAAALVGDELIARIDDRVVWRGRLDADALALAGPAGLRTDNVALDAELLVAPAPPGQPARSIPGCE